MQCPRCRSEIRGDQRFCAQCGIVLDQSCRACGFAIVADARFCGGCGQAVAPLSVGGKTESRPPATAAPHHLAKKILASRSVLEGKRREVTVLVGDVVQSNHRGGVTNGRTKPRFAEEALRFMAEAVHRYSGMVERGVDDGVIALFGAPIALNEHALGAVKAAFGIKNTFNGYSAHLRDELGVEVQPRLGLNTGPVMVRRIGEDLRMDYAPVGDTTELPVRLLEQAEPGSILITETTYRLVAEWVASEPLVPVRVTGRAEAIGAYRLTGRRQASSPRAVVRLTRDVTTSSDCPRCQHANRPTARFCRHCGIELRTMCPSCQTPLGSNSTFCDACGVRL